MPDASPPLRSLFDHPLYRCTRERRVSAPHSHATYACAMSMCPCVPRGAVRGVPRFGLLLPRHVTFHPAGAYVRRMCQARAPKDVMIHGRVVSWLIYTRAMPAVCPVPCARTAAARVLGCGGDGLSGSIQPHTLRVLCRGSHDAHMQTAPTASLRSLPRPLISDMDLPPTHTHRWFASNWPHLLRHGENYRLDHAGKAMANAAFFILRNGAPAKQFVERWWNGGGRSMRRFAYLPWFEQVCLHHTPTSHWL
jgi:hypothetical protein